METMLINQSLGNEVINDERRDLMFHFDDIKPEFLNICPPELEAFRKLGSREKDEQGEKFYKQEFIKEYLAHKWSVHLHNRNNYLWFLWILDRVLPENKQRVQNKITNFYNVMAGYADQFPCGINIPRPSGQTNDHKEGVDWDD
jgi:hypothetical protein